MVFICRLCGKYENESSGLAIFGENGVKGALAYKIKLSLDISIYEYDPLPKYICKCCHEKLIDTFGFQERCRRTQILLRERFLGSKNWSPTVTTSGIELEHFTHSPEQGTSCGVRGPKGTEDNLYACISEGTSNLKEVDPKHIEYVETVPLPEITIPVQSTLNHDNSQAQRMCFSAEPLLPLACNIQTEETDMPVQTEVPLTIYGEPFEFSTLLRNGMLQNFMTNTKDKRQQKPKSRPVKKRNPTKLNSQELCGRKDVINILEPSLLLQEKDCVSIQKNCFESIESLTSDQTLIQETGNVSGMHAPCSSGVGSRRRKILDAIESSTKSTESGNENMHMQKDQDIYIGPDLYETQSGIPQCQQEDVNANTLQIVDVFSVREVPNTCTPVSFTTSNSSNVSRWNPVPVENQAISIPVPVNLQTNPQITSVQTISNVVPVAVVINTPNNSTIDSWHSPPPVIQSNSVPVSSQNLQSQSGSAANAKYWHSASPRNISSSSPVKSNGTSVNLKNSVKKRKKDAVPTADVSRTALAGEEDEIRVVEIVKANKGSIAQHWERTMSGFKCKLCNKSFQKLIKCENHVQSHLGIKPYECNVCKRRYTKKRLLNEHYIHHTGKKLYQCKKCDKSFRYRKNFKIHAETHFEDSESSYLCEICKKTFKLQFEYWSHKTSKHIIVESDKVVVID